MRSFTFPREVDSDGMKANLSDGLLRISVPKKAEAVSQTKQISISQVILCAEVRINRYDVSWIFGKKSLSFEPLNGLGAETELLLMRTKHVIIIETTSRV